MFYWRLPRPQAVAGVAANNDLLYTPAFIVGLLGSGAMLAYCIKRTIDTSELDRERGGKRCVWGV